MLSIAEQVYSPLSDNISGKNTYSTELLFAKNTTVELLKDISMLGSTTRLGTELAAHLREYL